MLDPLTVTKPSDPLFVPANNKADIKRYGGKLSKMLTVWRKLHVELDSMKAVTGNEVQGTILDMDGAGNRPPSGNSVTELTVSNNLDDGSPDRDPPGPGFNGRFENGKRFLVGAKPGTQQQIAPIEANGDDRFLFPTAQSINGVSFRAEDRDNRADNETITGTIDMVTKIGGGNGARFVWELNVTSGGPVDWSDFMGETLFVGGDNQGVTIDGVNPGRGTFTTRNMRIPYKARDDDDQELLPCFPDQTFMAKAYGPAYIHPVPDGGGNSSNNSLKVPFVLNTDVTTKAKRREAVRATNALQSGTNRANTFWVGYILKAYQSNAAPALDDRSDNDPDSEFRWGGVATDFSGIGALVFTEEVRDVRKERNFPVGLEARIAAHEIAHQFGLPDRRGANNGLMSPELNTNASVRFNADDISCLRSREPSPGVGDKKCQ
jgi:hypothetical protein